MIAGRVAYIVLLLLGGGALIWTARARDHFLGWLVAVALVIYISGGLGFGWYLDEIHGRSYYAPDELAYQVDGLRIAESWRSGVPYTAVIANGWTRLNAAVILVWGPSLVPMRLLNAVVAAATLWAVYQLATTMLRTGAREARTAALLVFLSPSLFILSLTNLKERMLGLLVTLTLVATVALIRNWSWRNLCGTLAGLLCLGELRHYYAAIAGWLAIAGFVWLSPDPWRLRLRNATLVAASIGVVLFIVTGTFLGYSMFQETVVRYVPVEDTAQGADYSRLGETAGRSERLDRRDPVDLARSLGFVVFGGFSARGDAGRMMALVTWPEWLANFALFPLALWAGFLAITKRMDVLVAIPCGFVAGMILLLAATHGEDWTTFRFRAIYWPVYLTVAAAGLIDLQERVMSRRRGSAYPGLTRSVGTLSRS